MGYITHLKNKIQAKALSECYKFSSLAPMLPMSDVQKGLTLMLFSSSSSALNCNQTDSEIVVTSLSVKAALYFTIHVN